MQVYTRYRVPPRRGRLQRWAYALLAGGGLVFLGWVFSRYAVVPKAPAPRQTAALVSTGQSVRLPPATNVLPQTLTPKPSPASSNPAATSIMGRLSLTNLIGLPDAESTRSPVQSVLEAQIALAGLGISPGSIDGLGGIQTRAAILAFQRRERLPPSGLLDAATRNRLLLTGSTLTHYAVSSDDIARLAPVSPTWLGKSQQPRLDYETVLELVAEQTRSHPRLLRQLNPEIDWDNVSPGCAVRVPNVVVTPPPAKAAEVRIRLAAKTLQAFDDTNRLLIHCPCSIARQVTKRPLGTLRVVVVARQPNYTFNPDVFPESAEARRLGRRLILAPGPNNPVGTAWIGLDRPGYGIHGTPRPEDVGRTESHGCFRLANWNAEALANLVAMGTPIRVEP
ncbi:MAG TPA: L,D-transpeptidase family protein [Verrucomicrobiota bacterium]|nr:L,D-transpeptidase family protein [Verrucomicrobiota bacterium]HNU49607.1 L,D-transpeptidase family protein [Verrucomicrobiota bacterium]